MTTWADIQKLASDLQRVQLAQSVNKLSEQNCVEVISKLIGRKAIDVVFTRDGHSYVTNRHLMTEVQNECLGNGGRCSLTEAAAALNVDFDHVDAAARRLVLEDNTYKLFNGELFSQEFSSRLHQELLALLNDSGHQTVQQLAKHWNISQELLNSMLLEQVNSNASIVLDESTFYNKDYLEARKNVLRGVLSAVSKPLSISTIQKRVGLTSKRFWIAFDELQIEGEINGRLSASRTSSACSYIPAYYDELITQCLKNIFRQSSYIQLSLLRKLGLSEEKKEVEKALGQKGLQQLPTLFMAENYYKEILNGITEELKAEHGLVNIHAHVQVNELPLEAEDVEYIAERIAQGHNSVHASNGYLFNAAYLQRIVQLLDEKIEHKAKQELDRMQQEKKQPQTKNVPTSTAVKDDDWGDEKGGKKKKGGGAKGKVSGGKQQPSQQAHQREEREETPGATAEWLRDMKEVPTEIIEDVAEEIKSMVSERFQSILSHLIATQSTVSPSAQKSSIQALQKSIKHLYDSICVFDATCSSFSEPLCSSLRQHLLRSAGADLANAALSYAVGIDVPPQMKESQREELLSQLDSGLASSLRSLFQAVKEGDAEKLHDTVAELSSTATFQLKLRQPDKQTKAEVIASYESDLSKELSTSNQGASALLSAVLLLFCRRQQPLMASGKFVSQLIPLLKDTLEADLYELLAECQKSVVAALKSKDDDVVKDMLETQIDRIRAKLLTVKE